MNASKSYSSKYAASCVKSNIAVNQQFIAWINTVENSVLSKYELYLNDIPDELYMVSFEDGVTADEMANIVSDNLMGMFS